MKLAAVVAVYLSACSYPHVAPRLRLEPDAERATVSIESTCQEADPFNTPAGVIPGHRGPAATWHPSDVGTGVAISEHYVLTAAHVVECAVIPIVHVTLPSGEVVRVNVERDDAMFGSGQDIARLQIASAGDFGLGITPPVLDDYPGRWCAMTTHGQVCAGGTGDLMTPDQYDDERTRSGDSGSGVYNAQSGGLVGIVVAGDGTVTRIARVGASWLEGT